MFTFNVEFVIQITKHKVIQHLTVRKRIDGFSIVIDDRFTTSRHHHVPNELALPFEVLQTRFRFKPLAVRDTGVLKVSLCDEEMCDL